MNLRLAYRIASMNLRIPDPSLWVGEINMDLIGRRVRGIAEAIKSSVHFSLDNVAEFYAGHDRQTWYPREDIPNWSPPFKYMFFEWNNPRRWNMGDRSDPLSVVSGQEGQQGWFVAPEEVTKENKANPLGLAKHMDYLAGYDGAMTGNKEMVDRFSAAILSAKWYVPCTYWFALPVKPHSGAPVWSANWTFLLISDAGKLVDYFTGGSVAYSGHIAAGMASALHVLGLGISFCHCKNVRKVESESDAGNAWHKRNKTPRIKFYTLDINPMREVLRHEGQSESVGMQRALHICRGHFATYSEDSPLFGKYVGTFWRPDHTRGSKELGEVHKRYQVDAKK